MANKTRSIELESGLIVNFLPEGKIEIIERANSIHENDPKVTITPSELETIRDTCRANQRAENLSKAKESAGGNGIVKDNVTGRKVVDVNDVK